MRIDCPSCDAEYEVQNHLLRPGRASRCTRCGHKWVPLAAEETPPPPPPVVDALPLVVVSVPVVPSAMDRLSSSPVRPKWRWGLGLAWIATIVFLAGAAAGLYAERYAVMTLWPPSERLFAVFGIVPAVEKHEAK